MVFVDDGTDATVEIGTSSPSRIRACGSSSSGNWADARHGRWHPACPRQRSRHDGWRPTERPRGYRRFLKIDEGFDIVVGWRHNRQTAHLAQDTVEIANWLIGKVTGCRSKTTAAP
jgi:hypothetical protein